MGTCLNDSHMQSLLSSFQQKLLYVRSGNTTDACTRSACISLQD